MVDFQIKINAKERLAYIPKEVVNALGLQLKLVGNRQAAVVYPRDASLVDVVKSLEILLADFKHGLEMQEAQIAK